MQFLLNNQKYEYGRSRKGEYKRGAPLPFLHKKRVATYKSATLKIDKIN